MDEIYSSYAVGKTMLKIALRVASLKTCILTQSPLFRHLEIQFKNDFIKTNVECIKHTQNMALQMKSKLCFFKSLLHQICYRP